MRQKAEWIIDDDGLYKWGDWYIAERNNGFYLIVSSGVEYGPFTALSRAQQHAEDVRAN